MEMLKDWQRCEIYQRYSGSDKVPCYCYYSIPVDRIQDCRYYQDTDGSVGKCKRHNEYCAMEFGCSCEDWDPTDDEVIQLKLAVC